MTAKHIQELLEQLGPTIPGLAHITQIAEGTWAVGFDERSAILLQLDDEGAELVFTCPAGQPAPVARETVYASLLAYNALWRETGGVRMAVADGEVLQIASADAARLTLERLASIVVSLAEKARVWRRYVESAGNLPRGEDFPAGLKV